MRRRERGQEEGAIGGCLVMIVILIVIIVVGGVWRTEVVCSIPTAKGIRGRTVLFEEKLNARHWVAALVKGRQPDVQAVIEKYMREGEQLTELSVTTRHTIVDMLLTGVTLSIYCPVTVDVKGKILRPAGPDAGAPAAGAP